jgi:magnesium transporter
MATPSVFHKRHPVGARPGTLLVPADSPPPRIRIMHYDPGGHDEHDAASAADVRRLLLPGRVTWVDVQGLGDERLLRDLAGLFGIHALALEDVTNVPQRPKIEAYGDQLLIVARMIRSLAPGRLDLEQVSLFLGPAYVLSFQERYGDVLDPVRQRIREGKGPLRRSGADYLAYALLDTIVDGYYPVLEEVGEALARLETRVMEHPTSAALRSLTRIKNALVLMNRAVLPQREALVRLLRDSGGPGFSADVRVYLRDTLDHCAQLVDVLDSNREAANGLLNTYLSLVGMRTNEVMKLLTIMASIFIPLTFLAGIYGMNFEEMPELHSRWGYPALLAVMGLCVVVMLLYFQRKGWLGEDDASRDDW